MLSTWLVILFLIAVNALYVAAEFSAVSVRRSRIQQLAAEGNLFARQLLLSIKEAMALDRYVAACQIGITISSLVLGAYGQATLACELAPLFARWGSLQEAAAQSTSAVIVLVALTVLQVILGELVPKSIALQYSLQTALFSVVPMRFSMKILSWFINVLNGSGIRILRWLRVPYGAHRHIHSPEEIYLLIAESRDGGLLEEDEQRRLHKALKLTTRTARDLMVPRRSIVAIDSASSLEKILSQAGEGPYTRVPVYRESIDHIIGFIHTKDLMLRCFEPCGIGVLSEALRPAVFVPEHITTDRLLSVLREKRSHQAVVIDEFGGVKGLVTLEDVLTELLGDVGDELKADQPEPERLPDGRVRLPGIMRLDGIERWTGIPWKGGSSTVGGHVAEAAGRIPAAGERITIDGVQVEVEQMDCHTIVSVLVTPVLPIEKEREPWRY
ncbi:MAG: hemolysin family protein [Candidatus Eremiobacteraeota bacterium]|nr:hemolysin family protein [Candidatus Eremiobacteraeota bacterium]